MNESMREEFEAWVNTKTSVARSRDGDGYKDHHVQLMWIAWQASRAALCVELPKRAAYEQLDSAGVFVCLSYELNPESMGDTVELARITDVIEAIHAAGVKTK